MTGYADQESIILVIFLQQDEAFYCNGQAILSMVEGWIGGENFRLQNSTSALERHLEPIVLADQQTQDRTFVKLLAFLLTRKACGAYHKDHHKLSTVHSRPVSASVSGTRRVRAHPTRRKHDKGPLLASSLAKIGEHCRFLSELEGERNEVLAAVQALHLEGVVAKLAHSMYEPDKRSGAWVEFKLGYEQEFVIGGYTRGSGARNSFGALIVGYYEDGKLRYASKVGTGFSNVLIRQFLERADSLRQSPPAL